MTNNFPTDALNSNGSEGVLDPIYLPFSAAILAKHFAPVDVSANPPEDYLRYYQESADRCRAFMLTGGGQSLCPSLPFGLPAKSKRTSDFGQPPVGYGSFIHRVGLKHSLDS